MLFTFLHIPKSGGSSVRDMLTTYFKTSYVIHKDLPHHFTVSEFDHYSKSKEYKNDALFTWVREPIQRTVSEYRHGAIWIVNATNSGTFWDYKYEQYCGKYTIDNWIKCNTTHPGTRNRQTRMLSFDGTLKNAIHNLEHLFFWVGIFECMEQSYWLLSKLLNCKINLHTISKKGWEQQFGMKIGMKRMKVKAQRQKLRELNTDDTVLWSHAKKMLNHNLKLYNYSGKFCL